MWWNEAPPLSFQTPFFCCTPSCKCPHCDPNATRQGQAVTVTARMSGEQAWAASGWSLDRPHSGDAWAMCLQAWPQGRKSKGRLRLGVEARAGVLGAKARWQAGLALLCHVDPEGRVDFVPGMLSRKLVRTPSEQLGPYPPSGVSAVCLMGPFTGL